MLKSRLVIVAGLVAAMAVGAGIGYAAIPGTDGTVQLCYKAADAAKQGGATVSVIDPAAGGKCKAGQQAGVSLLDQALVTGNADGLGGSGFTFPHVTLTETQVTTTKPTKLFVIGTVESTVICPPAELCSLRYGLFVDGELVPMTVKFFRELPAAAEQEKTAFAVVPVGAGTHTVTWRYGNVGDITNSSGSFWVGAIAMGG